MKLTKTVKEAVIQVVEPAQTIYKLELKSADMARVLLALGHLCDQSTYTEYLYNDLCESTCSELTHIPNLSRHPTTGNYVITSDSLMRTLIAMDK